MRNGIKRAHILFFVKIEGALIVSDREKVKPYHVLINN